MLKHAALSEDRKHRFTLYRVWNKERPPLVFVGLNPSTADEEKDDPTIRRCIGFARRHGFGSIIMVNLMSYRATDPKELKGLTDSEAISGPDNDAQLVQVFIEAKDRAGWIMCAWGANETRGFEAVVIHIAEKLGLSLHCLGTTSNGSPRHPLYVRHDEPIREWKQPK